MREVTRRQALIGTGALAALTVVGIATQTDNASATVTGDFTIPDAQTVLADQTLEDVRLACDAEYSFESNAPIHAVELELHVGATPDTVDMIARSEQTDLGRESLTGTETLSGSIPSAADFTIDNFEPTNGELRRTVVADLRLYLIRDGEVVSQASHTDTFEITIRKEALTIDMTLQASGEITFKKG